LRRVILSPTENSSRYIESRRIQKPRVYITSNLGVGDSSKWMKSIPVIVARRTNIFLP
jgi:hypothetical protein